MSDISENIQGKLELLQRDHLYNYVIAPQACKPVHRHEPDEETEGDIVEEDTEPTDAPATAADEATETVSHPALDADRNEPYLTGLRGGHPGVRVSGMFLRKKCREKADAERQKRDREGEEKSPIESSENNTAGSEVYVCVEIQRMQRDILPLAEARFKYPQAIVDYLLEHASYSNWR